DLGVSRASTKIAGQIMPDLFVGGIRALVEKLLYHHDKTRSAEAALKRASLDEGFLDGIELLSVADALDRDHVRSVDQPGQIQTGRYRLRIHIHRATAAQALAAA